MRGISSCFRVFSRNCFEHTLVWDLCPRTYNYCCCRGSKPFQGRLPSSSCRGRADRIPSPPGLFTPYVQPGFLRYLQQGIVAMQHKSLTCSHSHLGTDNRAVSRNVLVWGPNTAPLAVCVREHAPEVKPRRSLCCTESEELCFFSWLIAFRCDQDCSHPTCNQSFQETCNAVRKFYLSALPPSWYRQQEVQGAITDGRRGTSASLATRP